MVLLPAMGKKSGTWCICTTTIGAYAPGQPVRAIKSSCLGGENWLGFCENCIEGRGERWYFCLVVERAFVYDSGQPVENGWMGVPRWHLFSLVEAF